MSLALVQGNEPIIGAIQLPVLSATYTAAKGQGAHADDQPIMVSSTTCMSQALVAIGDYAVGPEAAARNRLRLALTSQLAADVQRIRMTGSAALDLSWLAAGRLDAALTLSNHPWDMAAGVSIAREAGAVVIDGNGARHDLTSTTTLAVTPELAGPMLAVYKKASAAAERRPAPPQKADCEAENAPRVHGSRSQTSAGTHT